MFALLSSVCRAVKPIFSSPFPKTFGIQNLMIYIQDILCFGNFAVGQCRMQIKHHDLKFIERWCIYNFFPVHMFTLKSKRTKQ